MHTTKEPKRDPVEWGPLVLHIRRLRQWYGDHGLGQQDLAALAGISPRLLHSYESCRSLPGSLGALLALSLALRVPLEALIDPRVVNRQRKAIDERRRHLHLKNGSAGDARHG